MYLMYKNQYMMQIAYNNSPLDHYRTCFVDISISFISFFNPFFWTGIQQENVKDCSIIDVLELIRFRADNVGTVRTVRDKLAKVLPSQGKKD